MIQDMCVKQEQFTYLRHRFMKVIHDIVIMTNDSTSDIVNGEYVSVCTQMSMYECAAVQSGSR